MKKAKLEKRTIIGKVVQISAQRDYDGEPVVNVDILTAGEDQIYVDVAFWGLEGLAALQGKKLSDDGSEWVQTQPRITKGARVRATGKYKVKSWKPTTSKKLKKIQRKGQISVYSLDQLTVLVLPAL